MNRGGSSVVGQANAARRFVQRTLAKRAAAPQRIGVAYCLVKDLAASTSEPPAVANEQR